MSEATNGAPGAESTPAPQSAALEGAIAQLGGGQGEQPAPEQPEGEQRAPEQRAPQRPEGWDPVAMDPATQQRFNRVYGQMKQMERQLGALYTDHRTALTRIEQLSTAQQEQRDSSLLAQVREAAQRGDLEAVATLTQQRIDLKSQQRAQEQPAAQPEQQPASPAPESNDIWGQLTPADQQRVVAWAGERDAAGTPRRPWFDPEHPSYPRALRHLQSTLADYSEGALGDVGGAMRQMDVLMGVAGASEGGSQQRSPQQPAVLGGGANQRPQRPASARLSPEQREIALAMYGDKLEEGEAIKRYEKALSGAGLEPGRVTERRSWSRTFK